MDLYFDSNKYTKLCVILQICTNQTQRLSRLLLIITSKRKLYLYVLTTSIFNLWWNVIRQSRKMGWEMSGHHVGSLTVSDLPFTDSEFHLTRTSGQWTVLCLWDASLCTSELLLALVQQREDQAATEPLGWQTWQNQQHFRPQSFWHLPEFHKGQF